MTEYKYTLFVDEAGDYKAEKLKPMVSNRNSEGLCIGGYQVMSRDQESLDIRRDQILRSFGGHVRQPMHFRNHKPWIRVKVCKALGEFPVRAFVVCSFKGTMVGHHNVRAEAAATVSSRNQYLYNFVVRLLLERVSEYVSEDATKKNILLPNCSIPDDHIDPRRRAFFIARSVLGEPWEEEHHACSTA
jgi:hypothetical protein